MAEKTTDLVHPDQPGFKEAVTPKSADELFFFKCSCGHQHFRHAGYMQLMLPYLKPNADKKIAVEDHLVNICVSCKKAYVWVDQQMYDVTDKIDLAAWEKTEIEAHRATGPGGQC